MELREQHNSVTVPTSAREERAESSKQPFDEKKLSACIREENTIAGIVAKPGASNIPYSHSP